MEPVPFEITTAGNPEEWKAFSARHQRFLERFEHLKHALRVAFDRGGTIKHRVDNVVFFYGRRCQEDLMEIPLLCMNGYSDGGQAILRGMYEKAVTSRYLHSNPDLVDHFLDYFWVAQRKLANQIKETFGKDFLPKDTVAETEAHFEEDPLQQCFEDFLYIWKKDKST